ncbi:hypothetical protein D3C80_2067210 [compost metagenome]
MCLRTLGCMEQKKDSKRQFCGFFVMQVKLPRKGTRRAQKRKYIQLGQDLTIFILSVQKGQATKHGMKSCYFFLKA